MTRKQIVLAAIGAGLLHVACSDFFESSYPSMTDAKRASAVDRGWLPSFLPEGSRSIREIHNIDTNETWCAFEFPAEEAVALRESLSSVDPAQVSSKRVRRPGVAWWPDVLEGPLNPKEIEKEGLELYKHDFILFAIDWQRGRAFFYRERA